MTRRSLWRSVLLVLISVGLFVHLFMLGRHLEMDTKHFSFRYIGQGHVMAAIDVLLKRTPYDHRFNSALIPLAQKYWNEPHTASLQHVLAEAQDIVDHANPFDRGWVLDDKGYVDLVTAGFKLFGIHLSSVYYIYFVVLGIILSVYAAWAFHQPQRLSIVPLFLLTLITMAPILVVDDQLSSLHEQRFFAAMGIVPLIGVLFVMWDAQKPRLRSVLHIVFQAIALAFVYNCRNDSLWQLLAVLAAVPLFVMFRNRDTRREAAWGVAWPSIVVSAAFVGVVGFQHATYAKVYYERGYASHSYWHNLAMGLSYDPVIAKEYDLAVDDGKIIGLVGRTRHISHQAAFDIFNSNFYTYQDAVRDGLLGIVRHHPFRVVISFFWYKPVALASELAYAIGWNPHTAGTSNGQHKIVSEPDRKAQGLYYRPLSWFNLGVLVVILFVTGIETAGWRERLFVVAYCWIFSCLVPIVAIPMLYLMGAWLVATSMFVHVALLAGAASLWRLRS